MFVIYTLLKATAMVSSLTFGALLIRLMITKEQAFCLIDKTMLSPVGKVQTKTAAIFLSRYMNGRWLQPVNLSERQRTRTVQWCPRFPPTGPNYILLPTEQEERGWHLVLYSGRRTRKLQYKTISDRKLIFPEMNFSFYHNNSNTMFSAGIPALADMMFSKLRPYDAEVIHCGPLLKMKPINSSKDDKYFVIAQWAKKIYPTDNVVPCNLPMEDMTKFICWIKILWYCSIRGTTYSADTSKENTLPNTW